MMAFLLYCGISLVVVILACVFAAWFTAKPNEDARYKVTQTMTRIERPKDNP